MNLKELFTQVATGLGTMPAEPAGLTAILMDMGIQSNNPAMTIAAGVCMAAILGSARLIGKSVRPEPVSAPANTL